MSKLILLVLAFAALASAGAMDFPQQYYVKGVFSIPYFNITEPLELWYDSVNNREVFSYYNGMDTYLTIGNYTYAITPQVDTLVCAQSVGEIDLTTLFPDLSSYENLGSTTINGQNVNDYRLVMTNYSETATYDFYVTPAGVPVRLVLDGVDFVFDSHPDVYIMDYQVYTPNFVNDTVFAVPEICNNARRISPEEMFRSAAGRTFAALKKQRADGAMEKEFKQYMQKHNKKYADDKEYKHRMSIYKNTVKFINEHNANPANTFTVGVNHFADMTEEEFRSLIIPKVTRPHDNGAHHVHTHDPSERLPSRVDWREKGAVTPVKDQGVCGSCYAFGSAGSLEGTYYLKSGSLLSLSEQQIVDCAWGSEGGMGGNQGCGGGYASSVYQWMIDNKGSALEKSYPYLMQNGYCRAADHSSGIEVKAYVNVTSGEEHLQDAVATKGPIAVAIDASHPPFRYYLSGVYYQPDCKNDIDDLDHEVLAVGYGTTHDGKDYWLVKNSWSTHWGMDGFVMMTRNNHNNCGIATQATYPVV